MMSMAGKLKAVGYGADGVFIPNSPLMKDLFLSEASEYVVFHI